MSSRISRYTVAPAASRLGEPSDDEREERAERVDHWNDEQRPLCQAHGGGVPRRVEVTVEHVLERCILGNVETGGRDCEGNGCPSELKQLRTPEPTCAPRAEPYDCHHIGEDEHRIASQALVEDRVPTASLWTGDDPGRDR
jgi:hypothetical protein